MDVFWATMSPSTAHFGMIQGFCQELCRKKNEAVIEVHYDWEHLAHYGNTHFTDGLLLINPAVDNSIRGLIESSWIS